MYSQFHRCAAFALGMLLCLGAMAGPAVTPQEGTAPIGPKLQAGEEIRVLDTADGKATILVRPAQDHETRGTLVLLSADGSLPASDATLERLRRLLPAHGWTTWLLAAEPSPAMHGKDDGDDTPHTEDAPAQPVPPSTAAWTRRIDATIDAARAEYPTVVIAATGTTAALLAHDMPAVTAVLLIDPVEPVGADPAVQQPLRVPVMEVLYPALALQRPPPPQAGQDVPYRRLLIETTEVEPLDVETVLTRRVRGWLKSVVQAPASAGDR